MQIRKANEEGLGRGYLACRGFVARLIHRALQNSGKERDCSQSNIFLPRLPQDTFLERPGNNFIDFD